MWNHLVGIRRGWYLTYVNLRAESSRAGEGERIAWDDLVAGYRAGDVDQQSLLLPLLREACPRILRKLDRYLTVDEVEELTGRVLDRLVGRGKLESYRGPGSFLPWFRSVVRNERRDYLREKQRDREHTDGTLIHPVTGEEQAVDPQGRPPSENPDPVRAVLCREIMASFLDCLGRQSEADREILRRKLVDHQGYEELAAAMSLSEHQAHLRFFRARKRIAACLEGLGYSADKVFSGSGKDPARGDVLS